MSLLLQILIFFLVLNALFWGLASHAQHCRLAAAVGIANCPPHWIHLTFGIGCFLLAVYLAHLPYFRSMM
jgi:hypothetical protein